MTKRALVATLLGVAMMGAPAFADGHPGKTDVFSGADGFRHTETDGARFDRRVGGFRLNDDSAGGFVRAGSFTLDHMHYNMGIDRAILSWNADCPPGTWVSIEAQGSADGKTWTSWYEVAKWGDRATYSFAARTPPVKKDAMGRVNEDTVEFKQLVTRVNCRVTLHSERPEVSPIVSLVACAVADHNKSLPPDDKPGPAWGKEIKTEFRSQGWERGDMSYRICGPTSTTMALTAHGISLPTAQVAATCWDENNGIYGNWPFIAAGASALMRKYGDKAPAKKGRKRAYAAYVSWPADWKGVEQEILEGHPCVVSIHYGKGELKGAPVASTDGHLILAKGFTKTGDVICHDPAARTAAKGRVVYNRRELHRARHGNPVILFHPDMPEDAITAGVTAR